MTFIDVRCQSCGKLLCKVSDDFRGLVSLKCRHCKHPNIISLAIILKQSKTAGAILKFPKRAPAQ